MARKAVARATGMKLTGLMVMPILKADYFGLSIRLVRADGK
jgi:hypothetical protein